MQTQRTTKEAMKQTMKHELMLWSATTAWIVNETTPKWKGWTKPMHVSVALMRER